MSLKQFFSRKKPTHHSHTHQSKKKKKIIFSILSPLALTFPFYLLSPFEFPISFSFRRFVQKAKVHLFIVLSPVPFSSSYLFPPSHTPFSATDTGGRATQVPYPEVLCKSTCRSKILSVRKAEEGRALVASGKSHPWAPWDPSAAWLFLSICVITLMSLWGLADIGSVELPVCFLSGKVNSTGTYSVFPRGY